MSQTPPVSNNWFVCPNINPKAEMRLFLFPYAGGSPAVFWKWAAQFPDSIETWIAYYPGRGSRYKEVPIKDLAILVESFQQAIQPLLDQPFAFFGYSLGGLIAYELTRSLRQNNLLQPNVLFISACGAPQMPDPNSPIHALPDDEFIKALQELNGIPEEITVHPEVMAIFTPALRADFEVLESYHYNSHEHSLSCPIIALGGSDDPHVSREQIEGWVSQTSSRFKSIYFPGDHFYLDSVQDEVLQLITREMVASHEANRKSG